MKFFGQYKAARRLTPEAVGDLIRYLNAPVIPARL